MCFSGGNIETPSMPAVTPAPVAKPLPPTPTETEPAQASADRKRRIDAMRYGMLSTIKTGSQGITGSGANLQSEAGKKTLGS